MTNKPCTPAPTCGRIHIGAEHTISEAAYLSVNEVFSCPKSKILDVGNGEPQGHRHRFGDVFKPHVHPADLNSQRMVFETPEGAKTMSKKPGNTAQITTTPEPAYTSLSFVRRYKLPRQNYYQVDWFAVPNEEYGDGCLTGYRAALELHQWVKDNPDDSRRVVREVMEAVMRVLLADHNLDAHDKRGAAVTFSDSFYMAVIYTAQTADFTKAFNAQIEDQLAYRAVVAERHAKEKADFVVRMKAAKAAKRKGTA